MGLECACHCRLHKEQGVLAQVRENITELEELLGQVCVRIPPRHPNWPTSGPTPTPPTHATTAAAREPRVAHHITPQ